MTGTGMRFYVRSPDGRMIVGYEDANAARAVALDYGEGAHVVDTRAQAYHPIAKQVSNGELNYVPVGGWGAGKLSVEQNLIESIKKGHVAIVHAFLAKGADPDTKDADGGPALVWAVARGKADIVELLLGHGADVNARDAEGMSALDLAVERNQPGLIDLLKRAGAAE
ncbi:MAG: ankyrin repeat domain-containing protein [Kiloniellales bacterium]